MKSLKLWSSKVLVRPFPQPGKCVSLVVEAVCDGGYRALVRFGVRQTWLRIPQRCSNGVTLGKLLPLFKL